MNKHLIAVASALLITGTAPAFAASTVDLTVQGTITPNACIPILSSGGVIEHGKMSAKDLFTDKITPLPKVTLEMTVTCDASVIFALKATDNRSGSGHASGFGLGFINGTQKLGSYTLTLGTPGSPPQADGETVQAIGSFDNGATWERWNNFETGTYLSVATLADPSTPRATRQLITPVAYSGYINPTDGLDLSNEVAIDGSATIEVMYL
ncbi:DUF1120 domain-containing protein [Pseudomonas graminis]